MSTEFTGVGYKYKNKNAVKITIITSQDGLPLSLTLTKASDHDSTQMISAIREVSPELDKDRPISLVGDKGYVGQSIKNKALEHNVDVVTPAKSNETRINSDDEKALLKNRSTIERVFARLYQFRRISNIYDKKICMYKGWCELACAFLTLTIF